MSRVVGVTGRTASGKDTVADYLVAEKDYTKITVSDILKELAGTTSKEELTHFQKELREDDPHAVGKLVVDKINEIASDKITIAGVRSIDEWETVSEAFENVSLVFVHVADEERFRRVEERGREGDPTTFEEFQRVDAFEEKEFDYEELYNAADVIVDNTDLTVEEFYKALDSHLTREITGKRASEAETLFSTEWITVKETQDGYQYTEGPPGMAALPYRSVDSGLEFLLRDESNPLHSPGYITVITGRTDEGESSEETVARELKEEAGIDIEDDYSRITDLGEIIIGKANLFNDKLFAVDVTDLVESEPETDGTQYEADSSNFWVTEEELKKHIREDADSYLSTITNKFFHRDAKKAASKLQPHSIDLSEVSNYREAPTEASSPEHAITKMISRINNRDKAVYLNGKQYLFGQVNSARSEALRLYRAGKIKVTPITMGPVEDKVVPVEEKEITRYSPRQMDLFGKDSAESDLLVPTRDKGDVSFRNPNYNDESSGHRPFLQGPDRKSPQRQKPDKGNTKNFFFGPSYSKGLENELEPLQGRKYAVSNILDLD